MMNGCLASPLSADRLNELVLHSKDYLLSHGKDHVANSGQVLETISRTPGIIARVAPF